MFLQTTKNTRITANFPQLLPNTTGKPVIYLDIEHSKQHFLPLLLRICKVLLQDTKVVRANT